MNLKQIIKTISQHSSIQNEPPILFDIGASGDVIKEWKKISYFSICILFDADDRELNYVTQENAFYKKLIKVNKIVVANDLSKNQLFYLTKSPYCSSLLEPDTHSLSRYYFSSLFDVVDSKQMEVVQLSTILKDLNIAYIDWFKVDSQGTDLRLYQSPKEPIQNQVILLEIEPGFIDAYKGEDKLEDCLIYMKNKSDFFLIDFDVKGVLRIPEKDLQSICASPFLLKKIGLDANKTIPGWAEIAYMNNLNNSNNVRDYILGWLFSTLKGVHTTAYGYAKNGKHKFPNEPLFITMETYSIKKIKNKMYSIKTITKVIVKKIYNKFLA